MSYPTDYRRSEIWKTAQGVIQKMVKLGPQEDIKLGFESEIKAKRFRKKLYGFIKAYWKDGKNFRIELDGSVLIITCPFDEFLEV